MENDKNQPEEIDWDKLEAEQRKILQKEDRREEMDEEAIKEEMKNLSEEEHNSPYPDEFLADINLLSKSLKNPSDNSAKEEEE